MTVPERVPTVVYIVGAGRSGSTLLESLLAEATGAVGVGEIRLFLAGYRWNVRCGCGQPFPDCPFWSDVMATTIGDTGPDHRRTLEHSRRKLVRNRSVLALARGRSAWPHDAELVAAVHDRLYRSIARASGRSIVVDSSKTPAYGLFLAELGSVDLRVVHLVRDPRAVAYSWQRPKPWTQSTDPTPPAMRTRTPSASAREWLTNNGLAGLVRRRATASARVRYEDLADDPERTISSIVGDLGLPREPAAPAVAEHGFLGNPARMGAGPGVVVRDDDWVGGLSRRDRIVTTALTGPLMLRYGYRP